MDSFDIFLLRQRDRIEQNLAEIPPICENASGTQDALDPVDALIQTAYTRNETVGHTSPSGRKEPSIMRESR